MNYNYCLEVDVEDIKEFIGEYSFLSNFWPVEVWYEGLKYLSSEAAFQAAKTSDLGKRKEFITMKPGESKRAGRFVELREDWDYIKRKVMYDIVKYKFSKNNELKNKLLSTFDADLEEGNTWNDTFWGVCNGIGSNVLGFTLMLVRAELRVERIRQIRNRSFE